MKNKFLLLTITAALLIGLCCNASAYSVTILGSNDLGSPIDTGLNLTANQHFSVTNITGYFTLEVKYRDSSEIHDRADVNPDGITGIAGNEHFDYNLTDPVSGQQFHLGSLVGQIGSDPYFYVGNQGISSTPSAIYSSSQGGELKLLMWGLKSGSPNSYHTSKDENHYGSVSAEVSATPIPGAAWLLGSGIIGLIGLKRRKSNNA